MFHHGKALALHIIRWAEHFCQQLCNKGIVSCCWSVYKVVALGDATGGRGLWFGTKCQAAPTIIYISPNLAVKELGTKWMVNDGFIMSTLWVMQNHCNFCLCRHQQTLSATLTWVIDRFRKKCGCGQASWISLDRTIVGTTIATFVLK